MTTDEQINAAIELLRSNGFVVDRPELGPWQTPGELRAQFPGLSSSAMTIRISKFRGPFPQERGASGRLTRLRSTPELRELLSRPPAPGRKGQP